MILDILQAYQSTNMTAETPKNICKYCNKGFAKESTLASHVCEKKRRFQQEKEKGVQWGLFAYLEFYKSTQTATKTKNYTDFVESPYYTAFVKFGRYAVETKCVNIIAFTQWLLKNNKKLDYWVLDKLYEEWLLTYICSEGVQDALERALDQMNEYAIAHPELKNGFADYFRYGNTNRVIHHICTGRIGPWVMFNCASGVEFLESLTQDQLAIVMPWIKPEHWQERFNDSKGDVEWAQKILKTAGL